ncbi:hypothetical protein WKK05_13225 [Nostoc sp. UHCC 0302]|uniref:hypothetical protein n=1 Tax=Nostoc sp. UHCC 0302 TaxID=3134896 RepID=UPI00311CCDA6
MVAIISIKETKSSWYSLEREVLESFYTEDITDNQDKLHLAFLMVAKGYARLSSQDMNFEHIYQELCQDEYYTHGLSKILLLSGYNPDTGRVEPLGTVRLVLASEQAQSLRLMPIEAMSLFSPINGWANYNFAGFNIKETAELTRFAVTPFSKNGISKKIQLSSLILNQLTRDAIQIAREKYYRSQTWAILPRYIVKISEALGITVIPCPEVTINYENCAALVNTYNKYWLRSSPGFYKVLAEDLNMSYFTQINNSQQY